ncbi:UDP-glucuronosyl/UDP-glucosyltransferase [Arabidopsis thaliana x Arabidopsis arenosa]|uniref:Glycosyltransferase n=1 Tax=Arabidopsis thaliana x Arabidopsis arenosa TaxID=1240361 RepID=A0A8T1YYZ5_9BRAS|nr:UDP-glucuronosyl/UDP-glucosyltransferase [Arabidopsis thaliana x Arabidopsis arenosa]
MANSHVAVLAFPFGSHGQAILAVTHRLATASPSTVFSFFNTSQSNFSLFSSDRPANIRVHDVSDGVPEGYVLSGNPQEAVELFLEAAPKIFRRELAVAETEVGRKVTCMLTDAFIWFAADMAAEMKVSWVAFWTSGQNSLTAHLYTDLIRETIGVKDERMEETLGFISGMGKIRVKDTPEGVVFGNLDSVFSITLHQMGRALPRAKAVFINSFEELDPTFTNDFSSKFKRYLNIGPLALLSSPSQTSTLVHDPHGCLAWIEKRSPASVAYIAFGRVATPPPGELGAIAQGLESSKVPFVWSLQEKNMVHLPKGFLDRTREQGMVVPWAPQVELLNHEATGVFVSHGGWNSVLESVSAGVPMICRPIFGDHAVNARSVEAVWEIGMTIINGVFTKDGFKESLDRVLVQDDGKKMKGNAKKLKELAQEAVTTKGSSFENFAGLLDEVVKVLI